MIYHEPVIREDVMHIACLGDSITYGAGVTDGSGEHIEEETWPYQAEQLFGGTVQFLNYGVCGRTLIKETDAAYTATDFYRLSLSSEAQGYIILLGTNDSKQEYWDAAKFEAQLEELVSACRSLPQNPEVVLVTPPCAFSAEEGQEVLYGVRNEVIRDEIVPIIKRTAERLGVRCFDLYAETQSHPEWFADGVHPNAEGNQAIAAFLHRSIMG